MGTITGISDLDPVHWPNSHWRSVKVSWDESTAGERQPRVALWEIEPLTTFPMYPSLFPLRMKRPWHPGASSMHDNRDEAGNGLMWLRGATGEQALHSLNLPGVGMFPWMQQRLDPMLLGNDHNQQYQAILTAGLQNPGTGDSLRQQFMQFQQPSQYLQLSTNHNLLLQLKQQQQYQAIPHNIQKDQNQVITENLPRHLIQQQLSNQPDEHLQQQHAYHDALHIQNNQLQQSQHLPSPSFTKSDFMDSSTKFSASVSPSQNMLGSLCPDGSGSLLNFSRTGQPILNDQLTHQTWAPKYSQINACSNSMSLPLYPGKDAVLELQNCNSETQNSTVFSVNPSGLLLPNSISGFARNDTDESSIPLGDSGFKSSMYGCMQDSSELLHSVGQDPTPNRTFVKVYKSGSVGRSLDITRFSSYHELREELGQMFGIEEKLEDPFRSGWQLVFVDRENDALLLGDDPWEAFVNNVWYIKILSPEDVQKMGEQGVEPLTKYRSKDE